MSVICRMPLSSKPAARNRSWSAGEMRGARDLHHVIEHHLLLLGDRRLAVVVLERGYQLLVQRYPTQKLCVRLDSIMTTVGDRHHRRDHLMLSSREMITTVVSV